MGHIFGTSLGFVQVFFDMGLFGSGNVIEVCYTLESDPFDLSEDSLLGFLK